MDHLKEENAQLKKRNRDLEEKNAKLDSHLNELEQYGRRQNLEIHSIPMLDNETNAEVEDKVLQVLKKFDTTITKDAIDVVHRLRGKPKTDQNKKCPSIIVRFIARKTRNNIYSSSKKLKSAEFDDPHIDRVFINENVTSRKKHLLAQANQKRNDLHWKYLWTNNGRIHLRKNENDAFITIQTEDDLHRIKWYVLWLRLHETILWWWVTMFALGIHTVYKC